MSKLFPHSLIGIVSVLPALLVMPAMGEDVSSASELNEALQAEEEDIVVTGDILDVASEMTVSGKTKSIDLGGKTLAGVNDATTGYIFSGGSLTLTGGGTISGFYRPDTDPTRVNGSEYAILDVRYGAALEMNGGDWTFSGNTVGVGVLNTLNASISANVNKIEFSNNVSNSQSSSLRHQDSDNTYTLTSITANEIIFKDNEVKNVGDYGDAEYGGGTAVMNSGGTLELLGAKNTFTNNKMNAPIPVGKDYKRGGGAILNQSHEMSNGTNIDSTMVIGREDGSSINTFSNNYSSTNGGAIMNRSVDTDGDAYLTINGTTTFANNTAALSGGAIYNIARNDEAPDHIAQVNLTNGTYTFTGNTASDKGGAIYNEGTLTFAGENTFSGNTANGVANDIYNTGTLTFAADSATKMDGGINGNGALTIASGAVLDLGTASIQQGTLTLDGTINATLLNATKFASFDVADFGASAGDLNLTLKSVGTYNVFKNAVFNTGSVNVADSSVFTYNWNNAGDTITVATKSVDEIVAATDVKAEAASAVVTLANAKDETAKQIGEILGAALADGNNEYVEHETKKLAPEDKPVAHSVASNVQNQVLALTANRMSGGVAGRAGGDEINADFGVWMQGLLNKSRYAGQFDGKSRGFAIGADALINKVFTLGVGYSFSKSDITMSHDGGDMDIDSNTVFVYGQYKPNQWFINATLSNTISNYTEKATVAGLPVETEYDVNSFGVQAMTGYDFKSGLTPMFGARYLHVSTDGHDRLIGHVGDSNSSFLSMVGGAKYAFDIKTDGDLHLVPEMHALATYDVISDKNEATVYVPGGSVYHVAGDRMSRLGGELGLGLTTEWRGLELSVNYDLVLHKDYTSHTGMLKLRYEF